ncbi:hypothetical protein [Citricoccus nitrophenolicus]|uniref:hypothetical protein n=1 Tax=Citricoccus nitrophenolicus TaxID=863575 RepID=UPI0031EB408F
MKSPMKFRKSIAALSVAASALILTGCGGGMTPENAPTPTPTTKSVATKTAEPTAAPTLTDAPTQSALKLDKEANPTVVETVKDDEINRLMREGLNTALDVDLDESWSKYASDQAEKSFTEEQAKDGAAFAMEFYHDLNTIGNFYEKRDGSKDIDLLEHEGITSRMDGFYIAEVRKSIKDDGHFIKFPSALPDGSIGDDKNNNPMILAGNTIPTFTYKTPSLDAMSKKIGDTDVTVLEVDGERTDHLTLTDGRSGTQEIRYEIQVYLDGDSWKVNYLNWSSGHLNLDEDGAK